MIKENQRFLNGVLVLIDTLVILFSLFLAYHIRFKTTMFGPIGGTLPLWNYALFTLFAVLPTYLLLYYFFGLYKPFRNQSSIFSGTTKIVAVLFVIDQPNFSRIMLMLLSIFVIVFASLERAAVIFALRMLRSTNHNLKHILIIGDNELAFTFARKIKSKTYLGYNVAGFLGRKEHLGKYFEGSRFIGTFLDLEKVLEEKKFDRVVIAIPLMK